MTHFTRFLKHFCIIYFSGCCQCFTLIYKTAKDIYADSFFLFNIISLRRIPICSIIIVNRYKLFSGFYVFFHIAIIKSCNKLLLSAMDYFGETFRLGYKC